MLSCDSQIHQASLNLAVKRKNAWDTTLIISAIFQSAPLFYRSAWFQTGVTIKYPSFLGLPSCPRTINTNSSAILILPLPPQNQNVHPLHSKPSFPVFNPLLSFFYFFTVTSRSSLLFYSLLILLIRPSLSQQLHPTRLSPSLSSHLYPMHKPHNP